MKKMLKLTFLIYTVCLFSSQPLASEVISQDIKLGDVREGMLLQRTEEPNFYNILPKLKTNVTIDVEGMVSSTTVGQLFTNDSDEPIEAIYVFPLPPDAAVHDMTMVVNNRLIKGIIQEKQKAKETYEKAKKEGKRAALTEQERPDIFTNSVANVMPGDTILVRLQYVEKLHYEDGSFNLRFPMVVGPRYIPGRVVTGYSGTGWSLDTDQVPDASRITPPVIPPGQRTGHNISVTVDLDVGLPLDKIESVSHDIVSRKMGTGQYRIELKTGETIPNKDFVLEYKVDTGSEPQAALFSSEKNGDHYFMLMAVPPVETNDILNLPKEIIFVLDRSGSMSGPSWEQAKSGLAKALSRLHPEDYFNIVLFNNDYTAMASSPVRATENNISTGHYFVNSHDASGGTEALPALIRAMDMSHHKGKVKMIVFITDGSVANEADITTVVNQHIGNARLFSVGIGSTPNSHLLKKISSQGRGTFSYISSLTQVESTINTLFDKLESPVLTDLALSIPGNAELYPDPLPDLFIKEPLVVFGRMDQKASGQARLTGKSPGGIVQLSLPMDGNASRNNPSISMLWAREKVSRLMDDYYLGHKGVEKDVIEIALEHHLLTKFTSLVAVEHIIANPMRNLMTAVVPTELPEGWKYDKVFDSDKMMEEVALMPQGATNSPLLALIGVLLMITASVIYMIRVRLVV